jgi:hypothetical protein
VFHRLKTCIDGETLDVAVLRHCTECEGPRCRSWELITSIIAKSLEIRSGLPPQKHHKAGVSQEASVTLHATNMQRFHPGWTASLARSCGSAKVLWIPWSSRWIEAVEKSGGVGQQGEWKKRGVAADRPTVREQRRPRM